MSYPQGYLYQPPGSLALYSCPAYGASTLAAPRSDELARSSSGSAFSPYPGSAAAFTASASGFSSPMPYSTDPATGFPSYMSSPYDAQGMAGALSYHPYGSPAYPYQLNDPAYRKNATRDATATLKAWLQEHRKNPYPTKGEKIMLAIITKMTLTQVSTWFANARRRLKKENKMTWAPRNKSEDEDDGDGERNDDRLEKNLDNSETSAEDEGISLQVDTLTDHSCSAESDGDKVSCRIGDLVCESGSDTKDKCEEDDDDEDHELESDERQRSLSPKPVASSPLTGLEASVLNHHHRENNNKSCLDSRISGLHNQAVKPKLWSLAEIATSDPKQQQHHPAQTCPSLGLLTSTSSTPSSAGPGAVYSASSILGRPIYYTSPFYSNYTNYGNFSPLQGQGILQYNSAANDGLTQTATEVSAMHKHTTDSMLKTNSNHIEQQFRPSHLYSKKGT